MDEPRVFVANFAGHDYSGAEKYGALCFVTKGFISFQSLDRVKYQVGMGIKDSRPDDWLALSGTNIINVLAAVLWFGMHGQIKILNYDKNTGVYREVTITKRSSDSMMEVLRESES